MKINILTTFNIHSKGLINQPNSFKMKNLKKLKFLLFLLIFAFNLGFSQENKPNFIENSKSFNYKYYVDVSGVKTKQICLDIETKISEKQGVVNFRTVGFPSKYFVLKTNTEISENQLKKWLSENNLELSFFGVDENALELLYINKKSQSNK